jgi:hypothetical protein
MGSKILRRRSNKIKIIQKIGENKSPIFLLYRKNRLTSHFTLPLFKRKNIVKKLYI